MDQKRREDFLSRVMTRGLERASVSFSKMLGRPVKLANSHVLLSYDFDSVGNTGAQEDVTVLITQMIGGVSGKSFLILNKEDVEHIIGMVSPSLKNQTLKTAFLLEIDNIISASVISELSEAMDIEVYGDVPYTETIQGNRLSDFLHRGDRHTENSSVIYFLATFQVGTKDELHAKYIWRLNNKIFELIPVVDEN